MIFYFKIIFLNIFFFIKNFLINIHTLFVNIKNKIILLNINCY